MIRFCKKINTLVFCLTSVFALTLLSSPAMAWQAISSESVATPENPKIEQEANKAAKKKLSDARIAELLDFAKQHHPEILPLLDFLKTNRPKKFDKVIRGIDRAVSKLEKAKQKSPEAYQTDLADWIDQSRIRLYAAQFRVAADKETAAKLLEKIRLLVTEKVDAKIAGLEQGRASAQAKVKRLEKAIESQKAGREATIQKRINNVTRNAPNMNNTGKKPKVETDKKAVE